MKTIIELQTLMRDRPRRSLRGLDAQIEARQLERVGRRSAVRLSKWLSRKRKSTSKAARLVNIRKQTLSKWKKRWARNRLDLVARGRPVASLSPDECQQIWEHLSDNGPRTSISSLQSLFSKAPRRALDHIKQRYVDSHCFAGKVEVDALHWRLARTVWAMDFAYPEGARIEGLYSELLLVRDLASGLLLATRPMLRESHAYVIGLLRELFATYGAPIVLKSDNGGAFIHRDVEKFLLDRRVVHLLSPPYCPSYNGSCEAGVGSLKARAFYQALRNDRPEMWSCDDIERARRDANRFGRPRGLRGTTPLRAFMNARPPTRSMREEFWRTYEREVEFEIERREIAKDATLKKRELAAIVRTSVSRSLIASGLLATRRRGFSPANKAQICR